MTRDDPGLVLRVGITSGIVVFPAVGNLSQRLVAASVDTRSLTHFGLAPFYLNITFEVRQNAIRAISVRRAGMTVEIEATQFLLCADGYGSPMILMRSGHRTAGAVGESASYLAAVARR